MLDLVDCSGKQDLKSMTEEELKAFLAGLGEKPFQGQAAVPVDT